jgi:hypothetical protein
MRKTEYSNFCIFAKFETRFIPYILSVYTECIASKLFYKILRKYDKTNGTPKTYVLDLKMYILGHKMCVLGSFWGVLCFAKHKERYILFIRNKLRQNQIFNFAKKSFQLEYSILSSECRALSPALTHMYVIKTLQVLTRFLIWRIYT